MISWGKYIGVSTNVGKKRIISLSVFVCMWPSYQDQDGEQDEEYETEEQLQARILNAALEFVPLHGWSAEAIAAGAEVRRDPKDGQSVFTAMRLISHCVYDN